MARNYGLLKSWPTDSSHVQHFRSESIEVLFVRFDDELGNALAFGCGVEHLTPPHQSLVTLRVECDRHAEVMVRHVLEHDALRRNHFHENALVRVVLPVRPMHHEFVEPSKRNADIIIPEGGQMGVSVEFLCSLVREKLSKEKSAVN